MIKCRLKIILAQRAFDGCPPTNLTELAEMTGLNRSALTNMANNKTTRYDANTLDALCRLLDVQVGDILVYLSDPRDESAYEA